MNQFPEVIFTLIKLFLSFDDYHYLLNSSKQLFGDLKKKTIYFHLSVQRSSRYIKDKDFQNLLLSKVENGWDQIGLRFEYAIAGREIPPDLPIHGIVFVHDLPLEQWNNYKALKFHPQEKQAFIPSISNVRELQFSYSRKLVDMNPLQSLSKLILNEGKDCTVTDISPLSKIPYLSIGCLVNIKDFSMFSSQRYLKIYNCQGLTNVSSFRFIRQLKLMECHNLTDVSALNGVYDLTLSSCREVKDISRLGNHHRLELSNLDVRYFGCLLHIPHVFLDVRYISDLSVLQYATTVVISDLCDEAYDISALKNVKKVELSDNGRDLLMLKELGEVPDLTYDFDGEQEIYDDLLSCLKNERLTLIDPNLQITGLSIFSTKIRHLTIVRSDAFAAFVNEGQGPLLRHLTSLTLDSVPVKSLEGFIDIPTVCLRHCNSLKRLDGLGRNRYVEVRYCSYLKDVSSIATVPIVTIEGCTRLIENSYECLQKVSRLKIILHAN